MIVECQNKANKKMKSFFYTLKDKHVKSPSHLVDDLLGGTQVYLEEIAHMCHESGQLSYLLELQPSQPKA